MKKTIISLSLLAFSCFAINAQADQSIFIDFGPNDVTNGNSTVSPDKNGNYWNNAIVAKTTADTLKLNDSKNNTTKAFMLVTKDFSGTNGILNGGYLAPVDSLLGEFSINTATQDFFYTDGSGSLKFKGFDPSKKYIFKLFGTRTNAEIRKTEFTIIGVNTFVDTLQTSGTNLGGTGVNTNIKTILVSDTIVASSDSIITIDIKKVAGSFAFVNAMKIEVFNAPEPPAPAIKPCMFVDFGPNDVTNGNSTASPDKNGNYWNNAIVAKTTADTVKLIDSKNNSTSAYIVVTKDFSGTNGILNGGYLTPVDSLLGDFSINTATQDFFYTDGSGSIVIGGLNPEKQYVFSMFGSRTNAEIRKTEFTLTGANSFVDTLQTSGTNLGGTGINTNISTILVSDSITPDADGKISILIKKVSGSFAFVNCMKINEFNKTVIVPALVKDTVFADNANFQFMGRVDFTDAKKPLFAYANTSITTKFQGTSVQMLLNNFDGAEFTSNTFYAIIDNGTPSKIIATKAKTAYSIAENLKDTTHSLEIIKITESFMGQCQFIGLVLDKGKTIETPAALPSLKIEYYGASSTAGYGIEGGDRPGSDNSYKADPAVTARELNAQLNVVSLSGYGMAIGWKGTIGSIWNKTIPNTYTPAPANNTWDFAKYTPDVVVIELGTNDFNATGGIKEGKLTTDAFKDAYIAFIAQLRGVYPTSKIVCANSYMLGEPGYATISNAVQSAVNEENASGDFKVYYFGFAKMIGGGFNGHPGVADGTNNGKAMADFIKNTVLPHNGTLDITAPVTTANTADNITASSATAHITADENGTMYYAVLPSTSTKPEAAAVIAGSTDFKASGNTAITAVTALDVEVIGLEAEISYKLYTVIKDAAGNISSVSSVTFKTTKATAIQNTNENGVKVYPNPVSDKLHIKLSNSTKQANIEIFSADGRQIFQLKSNSEDVCINASSLNTKGLIVVKVSTEAGSSLFKTILK